MSLAKRIGNSFRDSYHELTQKVSWPSREELTSSAIVVMVASLIIALFVLLVDTVFEFLLTSLYSLFR